MLKHMRKLFAVLLVMVLVLGLFPTFAAAQTTSAKRVHVFTALENAALDTDVFAKIEIAKATAAQPMGGVAKLQEADYVNMIPQVIDAIKSSKTYVPGTLQQNGNFLVWETTVGIPCCYDPRMEAELHNTENEPSAEEIARIEAQAEAMVQDFSQTRGGSPSSTKIGLIQPYWESSSSYSDSSFTSYSPYYKTVWQNLYGATGGTVIHAKGAGMEGAEKFFGISLASDKEMIFIVVRSELRRAIMSAIMQHAGTDTKACAICFSLPVTDTAGLRLLEEE